MVLEMAGRAVPVIAADVGGIRETFGSQGLTYYSAEGDFESRYAAFLEAVEEYLAQSWSLRESALRTAHEAVAQRHNQEQFDSAVSNLFETAARKVP